MKYQALFIGRFQIVRFIYKSIDEKACLSLQKSVMLFKSVCGRYFVQALLIVC